MDAGLNARRQLFAACLDDDRGKQARPLGPIADFPAMIADLRALGWSMQEIGEQVNVAKQTIHDWSMGCEPGFNAGRAFEIVYRREVERAGQHELYVIRVRQSLPFSVR